jgi:hypothetical protein
MLKFKKKLVFIFDVIIIYFKYRQLNKSLFYKKNNNNNGTILVEFNAFCVSHIFFSYLSNFLGNKFNSNIEAFYNNHLVSSNLHRSYISKIKWTLGSLLNLRTFGIYKSFGVKKFINPEISDQIRSKSLILSKNIFDKIEKKEDILKIKIDNVIFGDLIYDGVRKFYLTGEFDFNDHRFKRYLEDFISIYFFWKDFFKKNKIHALIGVHLTYSYGIIFRVAKINKVQRYAVFEGRIIKVQGDHYDLGFKNYRTYFNRLSNNDKKKGIELGKRLVKKRFSGATGKDIKQYYANKSIFAVSKKNKKRIFLKNNKIKILILTHNYLDCINAYEKSIFPDFVEWTKYLGDIAKNTKFDWYIKDHPPFKHKFKKYQPLWYNETSQIIKKYSNLNLISNNSSPFQLAKEGLSAIVTMYGSVSFEYPYLGIPVISTAKNTPTMGYKFNEFCYTKLEIVKKINRIKKISKKFSKKDIYEFYFMHFIYSSPLIFMSFYDKFFEKYKKWDLLFTSTFYKFWLNNWTKEIHDEINLTLSNFITSNDIVLNINHNNKYKNKMLNNNLTKN